MEKTFFRLKKPEQLRKKLEEDLIRNSSFLWRVFHQDERYAIFATEDLKSALAVLEKDRRVMFAGNWDGVDVPLDLLPGEGLFVASSPLTVNEQLKNYYKLEGEWPCWHFLAPDGFGKGEWDNLGPLTDADVSFIAPFWLLGDDDREQHIRESVRHFESACLRVDGTPVSWCGLHFEMDGVGNLGFAHTLEEHRRKGHAQTVTKALVNKLHLKGRRATADVIKDNAASIATCKSMGFEVIGELGWADFSRKE